MDKFGGPIVYLIVYAIFLFALLVWFDSGSKVARKVSSSLRNRGASGSESFSLDTPKDVENEAFAVESSSDALRVLRVSKKYPGSTVKSVEDMSFGVSRNTIFALLGPNRAGKTSTFNIIRASMLCFSSKYLFLTYHP